MRFMVEQGPTLNETVGGAPPQQWLFLRLAIRIVAERR